MHGIHTQPLTGGGRIKRLEIIDRLLANTLPPEDLENRSNGKRDRFDLSLRMAVKSSRRPSGTPEYVPAGAKHRAYARSKRKTMSREWYLF